MAWSRLTAAHPTYTPARNTCNTMADPEQPCQQPPRSKSHESVAAVVLLICALALAPAAVLAWSSGALARAPSYDIIALQQNSRSLTEGHVTGQQAAEPHGTADSPVAVTSSKTAMDYFPQANRCGDHGWMNAYSQLHQDITTGKLPPRYLVSISVRTGMADRLTGLITQFYIALLSKRALTTVTFRDLPAFSAVCDMPDIKLAHPQQLPEEVIQPFTTLPFVWRDGIQLPSTVNSSQCYPVNTVNMPRMGNWVSKTNFSNFPSDNPAVENVLWSSNRGGTYALLHNSYHRAQLWGYGLTPETAFMCGFFYMCRPNRAVQLLYQHFWQALSVPGALKIGIQVRFGDPVLDGAVNVGRTALLAIAKAHFECAKKVEKAYAVPGQPVIWYLISDSLELCQAAQQKYGDKVLTETKVKPVHVDCSQHGGGDPEACSPEAIDLALQHALGQQLTFSKADYHIVSSGSGFGRLGAWMSGKFDNIFEIGSLGAPVCNPFQPVAHSKSSSHGARVRHMA